MKVSQLSIRYITVIALLVIHLLPVWGFKYFPTQDGASHIYNAYVLKEYHNHENYRLREVYKLNPTFFPNWTSHALLLLLLYIFPPLICEKIVLTLCIGLLPLSLFYFLKGVQKKNVVFGLVGFIFAYNYLLHMGFYNFVLSLSLFFFTMGYWWRVKDKLRWTNLLFIYILLLATYFTHYHSYALLIISLTFFALFLSVYEILHEVWGNKKTTHPPIHRFKDAMMKLKPTLIFIVTLLPAYFIFFSYYLYLVNAHGSEGDHRGFEWLINYFFSMKSLVSFRDDHVLIGRMLLTLFGIAFMFTVINRVREFQKESEFADERLWTRIVTQTDGFLIMSVLVTAMYFISPWSGFSGGWLNDRFHLYIFLILLPFFSINLHRYINYGVAGVIIVLSLWHLGYNIHTYTMLNRDITNALSLEGMDEKHTILQSLPGEWNGFSDSLGFEPEYVEPFGHIESLLAVKKGIAYLNNYEANTDHFPLRYKEKDLPADFIIVWRTEYDDVEGLEEEYDLIDSNNYNRLYRRKRVLPDTQLWKGVVGIAFDMQPRDAQTASGFIPVYTDTVFTDGKYGWLTQSELDDFKSESENQPMHRDSILGEEDGVFRVTLPNGKYEVICDFGLSESEPLEINLIANGEKKIQRLQIPAGSDRISRTYRIEITDEILTQVIHARGKGKYKRWGWCSCTILCINGDMRFNLPEKTDEK